MTIGNSMNLDFTINPDFSQVEVDQQVTNLTRFSIALPERRQFFVENSDLFSDFGNRRDAKPFFSRRIGIAKDLDGNIIENDIIAGVRFSGKLTNNLRLGILNMQTAEDIKNEIAASNNAVVALQQKLFSRSNLSFLFINKQATKDYDFLEDTDTYNRVLGLEYNLASADNTWFGEYYVHKSFSPNVKSKDYSFGVSTEYNTRNFNARFSGRFVNDNFRSDLGFVRRTDIFKIDPRVTQTFRPKKGVFNEHSISVIPIFIWKPELNFKNADYTIITEWESKFNSQAELRFSMYNRYTYLFDAFDPTSSDDGISLPENTDYSYTSFELNFESDRSKSFSYAVESSVGQFFNGNKFSLEAQLGYRMQPYLYTSANISYDKINLPQPYPDASIWLIGPKKDVTFSKKMFWSTFVQYSNQRDNFGINSRLQWRLKPLSDLFIVYNDNYLASNFAPRQRALSVKFTYWISI